MKTIKKLYGTEVKVVSENDGSILYESMNYGTGFKSCVAKARAWIKRAMSKKSATIIYEETRGDAFLAELEGKGFNVQVFVGLVGEYDV